ncbi:sulfate/molybdate ABC transporter ATP-binding protein [Demequina sp. NBRC 110051]|uniref:sulfate/molybdate ABC transporter ATP-binding protein n=1 Tax=Demequina sp. NBRC 110051 TaxID=1570340 RepID=UPI0013562A0C|nr:ATP-binding cassette domain-containing protein [Demequina sp. NBRC 110051]
MRLDCSASVPERAVAARITVESGRTLALLGPNGSGKSTMLEVAAGLLRPADAHVTLGGADRVLCQDATAWLPPHRRPVTLLTQDPSLFAGMSVLDNVAFGPRAAGHGKRASREVARDWLDRVGAADIANAHASTLSGGQAQRVALARALATRPAVLLLDEPFAALDVDAAGHMRTLLSTVLADLTVVMSTHDVLDAAMLADDVVVMHDGAVAERGTRAEVLGRPRHSFTARLVGRGLVRVDASTWTAPRPSQVSLRLAADLPESSTAEDTWHGTVARVEGHDDVARVWVDTDAGDLVADVDPLIIDRRILTPGAAVACTVASDVETYPA